MWFVASGDVYRYGFRRIKLKDWGLFSEASSPRVRVSAFVINSIIRFSQIAAAESTWKWRLLKYVVSESTLKARRCAGEGWSYERRRVARWENGEAGPGSSTNIAISRPQQFETFFLIIIVGLQGLSYLTHFSVYSTHFILPHREIFHRKNVKTILDTWSDSSYTFLNFLLLNLFYYSIKYIDKEKWFKYINNYIFIQLLLHNTSTRFMWFDSFPISFLCWL